MSFGQTNSQIELKDILDKVSESQILAFYLNIKELPCVINSPFRIDKKPSFGLYVHNNKIYYKDFAIKDEGGLCDLLAKLWNTDFTGVLNKLNKDLNLLKKVNPNIAQMNIQQSIQEHNKNVDLQCKIREWRDYDIEYWKSYGITLDWLKYADVYPISHKIVIKDGQKFVFGVDKYAYAFVEHKEGKTTIKIYQPFNTQGYKWASKHDRSVVSLWTKIPAKGDRLVICSSLKDALCLSCNMRIPALAVQGEGFKMSETAIKDLRNRYIAIYVLFDNDEPGLEDAKKFSEETGFYNLVLPPFEGGKDISDMYKAFGFEKFKQTINRLFDLIDDLPF